MARPSSGTSAPLIHALPDNSKPHRNNNLALRDVDTGANKGTVANMIRALIPQRRETTPYLFFELFKSQQRDDSRYEKAFKATGGLLDPTFRTPSQLPIPLSSK